MFKIRVHFNWLIAKKHQYTELSAAEYYERFGILLDVRTGIKHVCDKGKLEKAYNKAWENRDFEINKFWTRAAYFWGFIVLIFGAYLNIITGETSQRSTALHLDLFLNLLGILFSFAWYFVILGSKAWQQNWEAHIDWLEDCVSGPLYKTIFYSSNRFYSVSKLNEIFYSHFAVMAIIVS
ncbi:MAG: hypothetical protein EOO93_20200 [Pedobacter sp.]|nr:MAG: hypothetical protein EOO93_20200 [Pedobacter sp.]